MRKSRSYLPLLAGAVAIVLAVGCASHGMAQSPPAVVKAKMVLATDAVHPGSNIRATVVAQIASGYHVNAHHPTLNYLIPTEVKFQPEKQFDVKDISYPNGRMQKFPFAPDGLSVYQGQLVIPAIVTTLASTHPGDYVLKGRLSYQACNDRACLPPASAAFSLPIRVVGRGIPLKTIRPDAFAKPGTE